MRCDKWCCDVISDVVMSCGRADAEAAGAKRKTRTPHSDVGKYRYTNRDRSREIDTQRVGKTKVPGF